MHRARFFVIPLVWNVCLLIAVGQGRGNEPNFTQQEDVIYGRKYGTALTMDVITPNKQNGAAIIWVISGGWRSAHENIQPGAGSYLLSRGYTVFAVVHGSQPKFAIPEAISDLNLAVRFIRMNAERFKIDSERIGITGGSAGGHLSLMQGMAGDLGNPQAKSPVDRVSSRVQAVACFYPPTDFLNYGKPGENAVGRGTLNGFRAPFQFQEYDPESRMLVLITDEARIQEIGKQISPCNHVTADDPPTLIIHGDTDKLVPIQQAELIIARLKEAGVPAELVVKPGVAHGWPNIAEDRPTIADWFDKYLAKKPKSKSESKSE